MLNNKADEQISLNKIMSKIQKPARSNIYSKKSSPPPIQKPIDHTLNLNPKQKITYFLTNIEEKIIHQIDEQKQPISSHQSPFFQNQSEKSIKKNQQKLKKLVEQKKQTELKYKQLSDKQFQLKHDYKMKLKQQFYDKTIDNARQPNSRSYLRKDASQTIQHQNYQALIPSQNEFLTSGFQPSNTLTETRSLYKLRPKSQLTPQDIQTLKSLKNQYQKFEEQISLKTIKHNQQLQSIRKQNLSMQQLMKKQKNQKKKKQIQLRLKDLQRQKLQRIKKYEQERIRLLDVKKKPKRFQKLMKQFENKEKTFEEKKVQDMKQRMKKKMLDLTQITQHQKRYQQIREQQLKQIQEKYLQQTRFLKDSRFQPQHKSRFYRSVLQQEKQRKLQFKRKQLATIQRCQRIRSYAAKVYQEHAPRLKSRQNEEQSQSKSQTKQDRTLSVQQRHKMGNNYLREVVKHLKQHQKPKSSLSSEGNTSKSSNLPRISSIQTKYKDYLNEQRSKVGSSQQYEQLKEKRAKTRYNNSIQQVKKIMSEQYNKQNRYQTIDKIKEIAQKLQHDHNQSTYIDKIRAKLQILQTIT